MSDHSQTCSVLNRKSAGNLGWAALSFHQSFDDNQLKRTNTALLFSIRQACLELRFNIFLVIMGERVSL